jgi:hypothetical protein
MWVKRVVHFAKKIMIEEQYSSPLCMLCETLIEIPYIGALD